MRIFIRDCLTFFSVVLTAPLWIAVNLIGFGGREVGLFVSFGQGLSLIPGWLGTFSRRAFYLMTLDACSRDVGIGFGTWFSKRRVRISTRVSIGAHCLIGSCSIGDGTLLGSNIDVLSGRHQHVSDGSAHSRREQESIFTQVQIGRNVWIGNRATVMANIGDDSVIGAGGVVVKAIPRDAIAVGNPARIVRSNSIPKE